MSKTLSILMLFVCVWMTAVARPKGDAVSLRSKEASPTTMDSLEAHVWVPVHFSADVQYADFIMFGILHEKKRMHIEKTYTAVDIPFPFPYQKIITIQLPPALADSISRWKE